MMHVSRPCGRRLLWLFLFTCVVPALTADTSALEAPQSHPLDPVIRWAEAALARSAEIKDYTALLTKRERVGDRLQDYEFLRLKIRHEPFSVYAQFLTRNCEVQREVLYVEGQNNGLLLAHDVGRLGDMLGTVRLAPDGLIAMNGQRYPLTLIGFKRLGEKLIEQAKRDRQMDAPTEVRWFNGAKVNGTSTRCVEVRHRTRQPEQQFAVARVFLDEQRGIPLRYEGYDWPAEPDGEPVLVEEYTYSSVQTNVGLSDWDFDPKNPAYGFDVQRSE